MFRSVQYIPNINFMFKYQNFTIDSEHSSYPGVFKKIMHEVKSITSTSQRTLTLTKVIDECQRSEGAEEYEKCT